MGNGSHVDVIVVAMVVAVMLTVLSLMGLVVVSVAALIFLRELAAHSPTFVGGRTHPSHRWQCCLRNHTAVRQEGGRAGQGCTALGSLGECLRGGEAWPAGRGVRLGPARVGPRALRPGRCLLSEETHLTSSGHQKLEHKGSRA
jgi:hypothetical protein